MSIEQNIEVLRSHAYQLEEEDLEIKEKVEEFKKAARAVLDRNNPTIEDLKNILHFAEQI